MHCIVNSWLLSLKIQSSDVGDGDDDDDDGGGVVVKMMMVVMMVVVRRKVMVMMMKRPWIQFYLFPHEIAQMFSSSANVRCTSS